MLDVSEFTVSPASSFISSPLMGEGKGERDKTLVLRATPSLIKGRGSREAPTVIASEARQSQHILWDYLLASLLDMVKRLRPSAYSSSNSAIPCGGCIEKFLVRKFRVALKVLMSSLLSL